MENDPEIQSLPIQWFTKKYPEVWKQYGRALHYTLRDRGYVVNGINENFFAATLGALGHPESPTVYINSEQRFYRYIPASGIFVLRSRADIICQVSDIMLQCADECSGTFVGMQTDASPLRFHFSKTAQLNGVVEKAKGILKGADDFFTSSVEDIIACNNGMLQLSDGQLLPFSPQYRRRNKLIVNYNPQASCSLFVETLMKPALAENDLALLQQWCGLALIGVNLSQVIVLLTGRAGGGKGTFIRVLLGMIGQNNYEQLRTEQLGGRFETSAFIGKTLLYGADVNAHFLNNASVSYLKALTGGDPLNAEIKNGTERPAIFGRYLVIVTSNERLTVNLHNSDVEAYRRRLILIEYNKEAPKHVKVNLSEDILANEASGVLNWMLKGLNELKQKGYVLELTQEQKARVENLLLESQSPKVFVANCLMEDPTAKLIASECHSAYAKYCKNRGWIALLQRDAARAINQAIVESFGIGQSNDIPNASGRDQRGWRGLKIK